jgi:anaerobic magnesium-protoporphyrin IX monomethyl ester cyclase
MSMNLGVSVGKFMAKRNGAKITFVSPPPPPGAHVDYQNPIIGLATMAAVLEKNGYEVSVVDCPRLHMSHEDLKREIARLEPDIVGITCVTATFSSALQAARVIKESYSRALIALGGPHATFMDRQILSEEPEVDIVVRGEGEKTILELASKISDSYLKGLQEVSGITFRKNGQIIQTPDRPFIPNLDQMPFPAYKYFPLRKYRLFRKLGLPIITSRGCPFQCAFCMVPKMSGKVFRARSPKNVVDELEWLRDVNGAGAFSICDEVFTYDKNRVFDICEGIKKRNIDLLWDCQTRGDQISKKLLAEMRAANCQLISFGVESGSQKMLDIMNRGTTVEENERAIGWAKEAGLSVGISMIVGYPGETMDMLEQTLDFVRRTEPDDAYLSFATPFPGTKLYDLVKDLGWKMSDEWTHYETRTPVFENPSLPSEKIKKIRETFYNHYYSWAYLLRQSQKGFYGQVRARTAMHHLFWQNKIPAWISDNLKKMTRL